MASQAASPALRLLNHLLHLPRELGQPHEAWVQKVEGEMKAAFVPENPHIVFTPTGPNGVEVRSGLVFGVFRFYDFDFVGSRVLGF